MAQEHLQAEANVVGKILPVIVLDYLQEAASMFQRVASTRAASLSRILAFSFVNLPLNISELLKGHSQANQVAKPSSTNEYEELELGSLMSGVDGFSQNKISSVGVGATGELGSVSSGNLKMLLTSSAIAELH
ncbi:hypothetical protein GGI25_004026 [Coemansia spiralis]|uniref:Uncharacterized protein n=1 Tax=Coemansia spiralis TaxID=417178 RepID=A0A9W8G5A8_9FUNG|nr:hypothetical protein GGI26_002061 [Coemansia sp. RSA 1358]KAJ2675288.1 hypothetical protein GGI25_004026 [Coemansia spiralis]